MLRSLVRTEVSFGPHRQIRAIAERVEEECCLNVAAFAATVQTCESQLPRPSSIVRRTDLYREVLKDMLSARTPLPVQRPVAGQEPLMS